MELASALNSGSFCPRSPQGIFKAPSKGSCVLALLSIFCGAAAPSGVRTLSCLRDALTSSSISSKKQLLCAVCKPSTALGATETTKRDLPARWLDLVERNESGRAFRAGRTPAEARRLGMHVYMPVRGMSGGSGT